MKNHRTNRLLSVLTILSLLLSSGCATIMQKRTQRIPVTSNPAGATISVNGTPQGVTPLELKLPRKEKDQVIRIESPGYNPVEIRLKRRLSGLTIVGNFLLGAGVSLPIGFAVAMKNEEHSNAGIMTLMLLSSLGLSAIFVLIDSRGSGNQLSPWVLNVNLTNAEGSPRLETILIDADEFPDIKWIRIRRE